MKKKSLALLVALCVGAVFALSACGTPYSDVELSDYIKVGKYKGLEVERFTVNVTSKEVKDEIKNRLDAAAETKEVKEGTVKDGDMIVISYEGKIDGKKFEGGSQSGTLLTIGSNQMIEGFESGLIGVDVGETKTLKLKFPDNYKESSVAGKDVTFDVTVDAIQKKVTPSEKEYVKSNTDYKNVEEFREAVKEDLEKQEKESGIQSQKSYLWGKVVENSEIKKDKDGKKKYPEKVLKTKKEEYKKNYEDYAKNYDMDLKTFLKEKMGITEKQLDKEIDSAAKEQIEQEEIAYYIADKEGIDISKKEYQKYVNKSIKSAGYENEEDFKSANGKSYEKLVGKDNITTAVYLDKVQDLILKEAKQVKKVKD